MVTFAVVSGLICIGSIQALRSQDALRGTLWLGLTFIVVALAYASMDALFAAGAQGLICAGVVSLLFLRVGTLMPRVSSSETVAKPQRRIAALATTGVFCLLAASAIVTGDIPQSEPFVHQGTYSASLERIGHLLFTWHMGALDILAIILLVSAIGATAIVRKRNA